MLRRALQYNVNIVFMMQLLPTEALDWINLNNFSSHSPIGCVWEIDLDYSDELHDLNNIC